MGDVYADPGAAQLLRGGDGGAAAAEGVQHHVAGVAAGLDDALQQGHRLLRGVAQRLIAGSLLHIVPVIGNATSLRLIKVQLVLRDRSRLQLNY